MKTLILNGWLQSPASLDALFPEAESFDYSAYTDEEAAIQALAEIQPEYVICWSLGGVLAVNALRHPAFRPRKIAMVGTPFQFMASAEIPCGCTPALWEEIRKGYIANPAGYGKRFLRLLNYGAESVSVPIKLHEDAGNAGKWLYWLDYLGQSSFLNKKPEHQPEVHVFHGQKDEVINVAQAKYWSSIFPQVHVTLLSDMSHALTPQAAIFVKERLGL